MHHLSSKSLLVTSLAVLAAVSASCSGLHSNRARLALDGPGQPTFAAPITPRGTGFDAPETALRGAGLHSIAAGPQSLPLTARPLTVAARTI